MISSDTLTEICDALEKASHVDRTLNARMQAVVELARNRLSSYASALLLKNMGEKNHVLVVTAGADVRLTAHLRERCTQHRNSPCFLDLPRNTPIIEAANLWTTGWDLLSAEVARYYGISGVLAAPLWVDGEPIGLLCHFARPSTPLNAETRRLLTFLAARVQALVGQEQRHRQANRYQLLNRVTLDLLAERDARSLLGRLLETGLRLVNSERGWVSELDFRTGELRIVHATGNPQHQTALPPGRGITWKALKEETPILAHDVTTGEWPKAYEPFWPDTRSELAVPLMIEAADVLKRRERTTGSKLMGVLNVESPLPHAFSEMDKELLHSLARHAAVLLDGLDLDRRLAELTTAQQAMSSTRGLDNILELMGTTIARAIGFDYVNISLVTPDNKQIKTEYVLGVPEPQQEEFMRLADHELSDKDIQASLVREPHVEVPDTDDLRFDTAIFRAFDHDKLIRVFVPMVASNNSVIGTVDAGYNRQYRQYIYEQDVHLLEGFVGYAVRALEQRQQSQIQRISHELSAPLSGIRSNSDFLQRRWAQLPAELIERKLADITVDAEILLLVVGELEYLLSGRIGAALITPPATPHGEPVLVLRDIIIKTVRQLNPLVVSAGLNPDLVKYEAAEFMSIPPLYLNQPKLNQVIYNLLLNAIKYARTEPGEFRIEIGAEARERYVIKIRDWGIGIRADLAGRIFDEGFRTPEAIARHVSGSGLGLTISRQLMRQMGGDLELAHPAQPTEFRVILPRRLKQPPKQKK